MINPRITKRTPVIVQGITGRNGRTHSQLMKEYGTNIVAGVSPQTALEEVNGIPVFRNCQEAVRATHAAVSIAFVGGLDLLGAMREAISAGIKYIVTPVGGLPAHDAVKAFHLTRNNNVVWIGPSTPGMAIPGELKLGILPTASLVPGKLGLMSKSGTLSYEAGYRLAQRNIGQSVWVGVGGDSVKGTRFADLVPFYAADEQTEALLILGEIGGREEEEFATALLAQKFSKPAFALIAGRNAPEGRIMGHAGALIDGNEGGFESKRTALREAGVEVFSSLREMVDGIGERLK